jgi:hypothetical protein
MRRREEAEEQRKKGRSLDLTVRRAGGRKQLIGAPKQVAAVDIAQAGSEIRA